VICPNVACRNRLECLLVPRLCGIKGVPISVTKPLLQRIFDSLSERERDEIVHEAGVHTLSARNFNVEVAPDRVIPPLLRRVQLSNEMFAAIVRDSAVKLSLGNLPMSIGVRLSFPGGASHGLMPITHVMAASIIVWQLSVRVGSVLFDLDVDSGDLEPPAVRQVVPGSVTFSLGGPTLLVSGTAFVIAAYARLLPQANDQLYWGGAALATAGLIELSINWWRTIKEGTKFESETQLNIVKRAKELADLNVSYANERPASASVPVEEIAFDARQFGVPLVLANQLLNQALPVARTLKTVAGNPQANVTLETESGGHAASAAP
jgi:hypothetical protein